MFYDFSILWLWLALALLLGAVVGWMTWKRGAQSPWFAGWLRWASIAWVVGLVVAILDLFPGRIGFWLETALLFFAAYVLGCLVGGLLKSAFATEPAAIAAAPNKPAPPMPVRPVAHASAAAAAPPPLAPAPVAVASAPVRLVASAPVAPPAPVAAVPLRPIVSVPMAPAAPPSPATTPVAAPPQPVAPTDPPPAAPVAGEHDHAGVRPPGFAMPRQGGADDLKRIRGIGPQNEGRLHALGVWHFAQIAAWTRDNVLWVGSYLAFPGRIDREEWVAQAKLLAAGRETAFSQRVEHGQIASKHDDGAHGENNIADLSKIPRK